MVFNEFLVKLFHKFERFESEDLKNHALILIDHNALPFSVIELWTWLLNDPKDIQCLLPGSFRKFSSKVLTCSSAQAGEKSSERPFSCLNRLVTLAGPKQEKGLSRTFPLLST